MEKATGAGERGVGGTQNLSEQDASLCSAHCWSELCSTGGRRGESESVIRGGGDGPRGDFQPRLALFFLLVQTGTWGLTPVLVGGEQVTGRRQRGQAPCDVG